MTNTSPSIGTHEVKPECTRDDQGRFSKGNRGGPGNPYARQTARLLKVIRDAVSVEDLHSITRKMVEMAQNGDTAATKILFSYVVGKPLSAGQPDLVDHDEWELHKKNASLPHDLSIVLAALPTELSNQIVSAALPHITDSRQQQLAEGLADPPAGAGRIANSDKPARGPRPTPAGEPVDSQPGALSTEFAGSTGIAHFDQVRSRLEEDIREARAEVDARREARLQARSRNGKRLRTQARR